MKTTLILAVLMSSVSFAAAANTDLNTEASGETNIIKHKKGWASVLTLKGDRGTGLTIMQGNKQARGISMKSGSALVTMSPSYVAAGVPNTNLDFSSETTAVVFKLEGAKLDGANGTYIAFDAKRKEIIWIDGTGNIVGTLEAN